MQQTEDFLINFTYNISSKTDLTEEYLDSQRLKLALKISPITLQKYISGTNIRSFVMGE